MKHTTQKQGLPPLSKSKSRMTLADERVFLAYTKQPYLYSSLSGNSLLLKEPKGKAMQLLSDVRGLGFNSRTNGHHKAHWNANETGQFFLHNRY